VPVTQLGTLHGKQTVPWAQPDKGPQGATTEWVIIGTDAHGLGFEVAVAAWGGPGAPTQEALRTLHSARLKSRAVPLCVAVHRADGRTWILGPNAAAAPIELPTAQAARLLQAALDEPSAGAARTRILHARDAFEAADRTPGFDSQGLFAIHELTRGVPRRPDWPEATERGREVLDRKVRGLELVRALGFQSHSIPGNAQLLTVGQEPPMAVAILLRDDEAFDAEVPRFGRSAIYYGLDVARRNNVRWLVVARGSELRLYPTAPDVGVGRRGATQTYFGLDLALLDDAHAGYLDLAFSARALRPDGTVDQLLRSSHDFAVNLGDRLRERIYERVVDRLSVAVATSLAADGPLDEARLALAYRLTLRILFRLLFQAYAEDTRLLPLHANERYTRDSLKTLAHDLAEHPDRPFDPRSTAMWDGLEQVWRVIDRGNQAWGVPAYNGGLFGDDPTLHPDGARIAALALRDDVMGEVLSGLLVDQTTDGAPGPVDFRSLDVRAFGTIYEGLLEAGLSVAETDLTLDASDNWRPSGAGERVDARAREPYFHTRSGGRKATGSYFTKPFAVEHLLDRALDPTLDEHLAAIAKLLEAGDDAGAARQFFDFRVADLAMGSGHFLVAAIGHIEARLGAFLEGHAIPGVERELLDLREAALAALARVGVESEIDRSALLGRQIARRCIYGIDINDIAVELARLAIWVRTFVPGLPMSSLDHQLVVGDSLTGIGSIDEAVAALDPSTDAAGSMSFTGEAIRAALVDARRLLEDAATLKETSAEESRVAQEASRAALAAAEPARLLFDAAVAVRLGLMPVPADFDPGSIGVRAADPATQTAVRSLDPVHFPARFPEVFLREAGGFDVLIGNPPWEEVMVDETNFWSTRMPAFRGKPPAEQRRLISSFRAARPDLVAEYESQVATTDRLRRALSLGPYPGMNEGNADLYKAFEWRAWGLLGLRGRLGLVLPRTALSGSGSEGWRSAIYDGGSFEDVTTLLNSAHWVFDDVHAQYTFALVVAAKGRKDDPVVRIRGPLDSLGSFTSSIRQRPAEFPAAAFRTWATGGGFPLIPTAAAGEVFRVLRQHPRLDALQRGWRARAIQGDFNATTDRGYFSPTRDGITYPWPVLSGASFHLWNPETGELYGWADSAEVTDILQEKRQRQQRRSTSAFSEFSQAWAADPTTLPCRHPRLVFRDVTNRTNTRTVIPAFVPANVIMTNAAPYLVWPRGTAADQALLLGVLASIPLDWYARCVVEVHLNFHLLNGLPIPDPPIGSPLRRRVVEIAGRLAAVDGRFADWASEVGVPVSSVTAAEKPDLEAELDAVVAHLYGLSRPQLEHIFETFHRGWDHSDRLARVLGHYDRWASAA